MTALTDRYVWAVLRAVPRSQRTELEPEIRALVADAIEARNGEPAPNAEAAERAALAELGDPGVLAARYSEQPQYLIGPTWFAEWKRLLTLLLPIIVPIVSAVVLAANLLSGNTVGQAITAGIGTAVTVTVQILFWVTLVFAHHRARRPASSRSRARPGRVDDLPELPDDGRISVVDAVSTVIANVVRRRSPSCGSSSSHRSSSTDRRSRCSTRRCGRSGCPTSSSSRCWRSSSRSCSTCAVAGRWTFAAINAALGAAFAIPAVWLLQNDLLFNPALVARGRRRRPMARGWR